MSEDRERTDARLGEVLRRHQTPEPSPGFVDDVMLRLLLAQHRVPEPSPDFVDRVARRAARLRRPLARRLGPLILTAAAAALLAAVLFRPGGPGPGSRGDWFQPAAYPARAAASFARATALVRAESDPLGGGPWFPPAPPPRVDLGEGR